MLAMETWPQKPVPRIESEQQVGARVLIVDDVPSMRRTLRRILESAGYDIVGEAEDGDEAVDMAMELSPDVVLMDVVMRRMDGIEATRMIKKARPDTKVIMVTQEARPSVVVQSMTAGAINFLIKPYQDIQILKIMSNAGRA